MNPDHDHPSETLPDDYLFWNDIPSPRRTYVGPSPHESSSYQGGRADYGRGSAQEPPNVNHPRGATEYRHRHGDERFPQARNANADHAGKGPLGYKRADERICDELYDRFTDHPQIDAREIEISVQKGVVSLRGVVPDHHMKYRAEDCAERISGVTDVDNRIRVKRESANGDSGDESSLLG